MGLFEKILNTKIDLSMANIIDSQSGLITVETKMTSFRIVFAIIGFVVSIIFVKMIFGNLKIIKEEDLLPLGLISIFFTMSYALIAFVFTAVSIAMILGNQSISIDKSTMKAQISSSLGGMFKQSKVISLPQKGEIHLTLRLEKGVYMPSSASGLGSSSPRTRWYDMNLIQDGFLGFTVASNREEARAFAKKISEFLGYSVKDEVEDDGVERLPAGSKEY